MPELPEVETVARQLAPLIEGLRIEHVRVSDPKLNGCNLAQVTNHRILKVHRLGKQIMVSLAGGRRRRPERHLGVHLRMTGRLLYLPTGRPLPAHLRVSFQLSRGTLDFCDVRRFGTLRIDPSLQSFAPRGIDPTTPQFTATRLGQLLGQSRQEIKVWLLRQDRLVGLGNIYACEILFAAKLDPQRPANSLSPTEISRLHRQTKRVLEKAIACCGTTFSDFQDAKGQSGGFARFLRVYGRGDNACRSCGAAVTRIVQQGRSTFFCAACQSGNT